MNSSNPIDETELRGKLSKWVDEYKKKKEENGEEMNLTLEQMRLKRTILAEYMEEKKLLTTPEEKQHLTNMSLSKLRSVSDEYKAKRQKLQANQAPSTRLEKSYSCQKGWGDAINFSEMTKPQLQTFLDEFQRKQEESAEKKKGTLELFQLANRAIIGDRDNWLPNFLAELKSKNE